LHADIDKPVFALIARLSEITEPNPNFLPGLHWWNGDIHEVSIQTNKCVNNYLELLFTKIKINEYRVLYLKFVFIG